MIPRRPLLAACLAAPALARAQVLTTRAMRIVVPHEVGGALDSATRMLAPHIGERLGRSIVVTNRKGANGALGAGMVARARDEYTLLADSLSHIVNPALMEGRSFDYARAFVPVTLMVTFPQVIAVEAASPVRTLGEFIVAAKARPGTITVGTQGNVTAGHLALAQFMQLTGTELVHVPYRGGADAACELAAGTVNAVSISALSAGPIVDSGRARFLAVAAPKRVSVRPDVPTAAEAGVAGLEISEWGALFAPAGTPQDVIARLHAALVDALAESEVRERLRQLAAEPVGNPPDAFAAQVADGRAAMARLVAEANIRLE